MTNLLRHRQLPVCSRSLLLSCVPLMSVTVVACVLAATSGFYRLIPAQEHLAQAEAAYHTAVRAQAALQATRKTQEEMRAIKLKLDEVWRGLPTETEFASLALAISELGRSERVTIPGMQYAVERSHADGMPVKASISFSVTGDYAAVYRFIHRLESADSYVVIESLDASRTAKSEKGSGSSVVFHVKVATFLRPNPPTGSLS